MARTLAGNPSIRYNASEGKKFAAGVHALTALDDALALARQTRLSTDDWLTR